jgi:hypothetical protein
LETLLAIPYICLSLESGSSTNDIDIQDMLKNTNSVRNS